MSLVRTLWARRRTPAGRKARFVLRYTPSQATHVTVGVLEFDGQMWTFRYDDEYKALVAERKAKAEKAAPNSTR